jgi:hypothetical protein
VLTRLLALALGISLTACTHYRHIDPQTPEGLDCLHKLDAQVNECEARVKARQDNYDRLHEFQALSTQQCEHNNRLNIPNACPPPPTPTRVPNDCRSDYEDKYIACGGRVEEVEQ